MSLYWHWQQKQRRAQEAIARGEHPDDEQDQAVDRDWWLHLLLHPIAWPRWRFLVIRRGAYVLGFSDWLHSGRPGLKELPHPVTTEEVEVPPEG